MLGFAADKTAFCFYWFWVGIRQKVFVVVDNSWIVRIIFLIILLKAYLWIQNGSLNSWCYFWLLFSFWCLRIDIFEAIELFFINFTLDFRSQLFFEFVFLFCNRMHLWAHLSFYRLPINMTSLCRFRLFFCKYIQLALTLPQFCRLLLRQIIALFILVYLTGCKTAGLTLLLSRYIVLFCRNRNGTWAETISVGFRLQSYHRFGLLHLSAWIVLGRSLFAHLLFEIFRLQMCAPAQLCALLRMHVDGVEIFVIFVGFGG